MDIKKYTAYFHDGGFLLAKRKGEKLEIWLASSEIELDWMDVDPSILSKSNLIVGKLTLFGIKSISANDAPIEQIREDCDNGQILDFEIYDDIVNEVIVELNIEWFYPTTKLAMAEFDAIIIKAERYEWENLPDYPVPYYDD